jgi:phage N-6-adenine-methyltransferase
MTLIGFRGRNHPQQTAARAARAGQLELIAGDNRPGVDDRSTPRSLFDPLHAAWCFTIDAAASPRNALLPRYWTTETDGLAQPWAGERVWCNPPYSSIEPWVVKASAEIHDGCEAVVMLLPANRAEQGWWQRHIEPQRDNGGPLTTTFLPGRIRFAGVEHPADGKGNHPPFGCVLLTWDRNLKKGAR